ncbi:hypothetical protein [Bacillus thuringiensis]|uniref:hypothetical protein n=1 Tax=Bacillus thuringiensis TaxID=1428 RepID=UPI0033352ED9
MVDQKIILDAYKKGPEAVISLFEETFYKLEKRIQELAPFVNTEYIKQGGE